MSKELRPEADHQNCRDFRNAWIPAVVPKMHQRALVTNGVEISTATWTGAFWIVDYQHVDSERGDFHPTHWMPVKGITSVNTKD